MYMACFELDLSAPSVRQSMRDARDMHRSVMRMFPDVEQHNARKEMDVLYRVQSLRSGTRLYVVSQIEPKVEDMPKGFKPVAPPKPLDAALDGMTCGNSYQFDLLAVPSKKLRGDGKNSKRVFITDAQQRIEWLERKAQQAGFALEWVREDGQAKATVYGKDEHPTVTHTGVRFCGRLRVTDEAAFRKAYIEGIGAEKAYGMGLLLLSKGD